MEVAYENNRTSELGLPKSLGSSGKVIHNATDDLRSLDMGSDGLIEPADNTFRIGDQTQPALNLNTQHTDEEIASLVQENTELKELVEKLRQDLDAAGVAAGAGRNSWDGSMGRGSWSSDQNVS